MSPVSRAVVTNRARPPEIRRSRRTYPANFQNVRRRAVVKFNKMSGERPQMSGEAQKVFGKPVELTQNIILIILF